MKHTCIALWALQVGLYAVPALAACPPEAWMCSSPMRQTAPNDAQLRAGDDPTLFEHGHFALQRDDSDPTHSELRPTIKFGHDAHMSLKVAHGHSEVKWKWNF